MRMSSCPVAKVREGKLSGHRTASKQSILSNCAHLCKKQSRDNDDVSLWFTFSNTRANTHKQTGRQTGRQTYKETGTQIDIQTDTQVNRQTGRLLGRQLVADIQVWCRCDALQRQQIR